MEKNSNKIHNINLIDFFFQKISVTTRIFAKLTG